MSKVFESVGSALGFGGDKAVSNAGNAQIDATNQQIAYMQGAEQRAGERLAPYVQLGRNNIGAYQNLLTPQGQYDYAMNNPLLSAAMDSTSEQLKTQAAATGRLASGGLTNDLFKSNAMLLNQFGQQGLNNYRDAVTIGQSSAAGSAANTLNSGNAIGNAFGSIGDIQSATILGRQNAQAGLGNSLLQLGGSAISFFSDPKYKTNVVKVGEDEYGNIYEFDYIWGGRYRGRMADELREILPSEVMEVDGALLVSNEFAPVSVEAA